MAQVQRTIPMLLPADEDLRETLAVFQRVQQQLSAPCFNGGKPLSAVGLHRACYHQLKGQLNAQPTCTAIRLIAASAVCSFFQQERGSSSCLSIDQSL
jgi:putative transposase